MAHRPRSQSKWMHMHTCGCDENVLDSQERVGRVARRVVRNKKRKKGGVCGRVVAVHHRPIFELSFFGSNQIHLLTPLTADKKQQPRWVSQCRSSSPASSARRRCVSTSVAGGRARE